MTSFQDISPDVAPALLPAYRELLPATAEEAAANPSAESLDLAAERARSWLPVEELTAILEGGEDKVAAKQAARKILEDSGLAALKAGLPKYYVPRAEAVANAHARQAALLEAAEEAQSRLNHTRTQTIHAGQP